MSASPEPQGPFGYSSTNPVLCHGPSGERYYLERLRCPNGHPFHYRRLRSRGGLCPAPEKHLEFGDLADGLSDGDRPDPKEPLPGLACLVDEYELICAGGEHTCVLYFDMYHPDHPEQPAPDGMSALP